MKIKLIQNINKNQNMTLNNTVSVTASDNLGYSGSAYKTIKYDPSLYCNNILMTQNIMD